MSETVEKPVYRAEAVYDILADRTATREQLVGLLIERISPFLNIDILKGAEKEATVRKLVRCLSNLSKQFFDELVSRGIPPGNIDEASFRSLRVQEICRSAYSNDRVKQRRLMRELSALRDSSNADFLAHFGFLPPEVFSRKDLLTDQEFNERSCFSSSDEAAESAQMGSITELFPSWFDPHFFQFPEKFIAPNLDQDRLGVYPKYARLAHWRNKANADFDRCVEEAFAFLGETFRVSAPEGPAGQMYEMVGDLGSLSFAALLTIFLNNRQDLRTRFEALRLLEWAMSFYAQEQSPIYEEQLTVRREIADELGDKVWTGKGKKFASLHLPVETMKIIAAEEGLPSDFVEAARLTARRLDDVMRESIGEDVLEVLEPMDVAVFDDRVKTKGATTLKALLKEELYRKWLAAIQGYDAGMSAEEALARLDKHKDRARQHGRSDADIDTQPVRLEDIRDRVGFTLSLKLPKMLSDYAVEERSSVEACFRKILEYLVQILDLQDPVFESTLWQNGENPHSSMQFCIAKVEGYIVVQREVVDPVTLQLETQDVRVPVEIQLRPLESHVRGLIGGTTGHENYRAGQIAELAFARLHPPKIGGQTIYPIVLDPETLDVLLAEIFE